MRCRCRAVGMSADIGQMPGQGGLVAFQVNLVWGKMSSALGIARLRSAPDDLRETSWLGGHDT